MRKKQLLLNLQKLQVVLNLQECIFLKGNNFCAVFDLRDCDSWDEVSNVGEKLKNVGMSREKLLHAGNVFN